QPHRDAIDPPGRPPAPGDHDEGPADAQPDEEGPRGLPPPEQVEALLVGPAADPGEGDDEDDVQDRGDRGAPVGTGGGTRHAHAPSTRCRRSSDTSSSRGCAPDRATPGKLAKPCGSPT